MKNLNISVAITVAALLLSAHPSFAEAIKAEAPQAGQAKANTTTIQKHPAAKRKAAARIKLVDINSATKKELMKLPGIGDADADKIIAGRPYGSKAWLVTHNVLPSGVYDQIRGKVIAKQPSKDGAKNAALYAPKK